MPTIAADLKQAVRMLWKAPSFSLAAMLTLALGLVLSLWLTPAVAGQLLGVDARDPLTFVAGSLPLLAVAVVATLIPAVRGTRVDPMTTLRERPLSA